MVEMHRGRQPEFLLLLLHGHSSPVGSCSMVSTLFLVVPIAFLSQSTVPALPQLCWLPFHLFYEVEVVLLTNVIVKALYDYTATISEEFDFQAGDIIAVTATPDDGWWIGELLDEERRVEGRNVFPSNFVCLF